MAIWLIRAGAHGEFEQKFIQESRVYVTWDSLDIDLSKLSSREELFSAMEALYEDSKPKRLHNWVSQVWPFAHVIEKGDLVVLPLKTQPAICIGEITGDYEYNIIGENPFYHRRKVKWIADAVPRSHFGKDLLFTFGAFLTICRVQRNNAEARINAMRSNRWQPENVDGLIDEPSDDVEAVAENTDLEEAARDQIAQLIMAKFKGHGLERLVEGILRAQGYTTYHSPEGADGGVDILAGTGPLGFGAPRLCVQVKSQDSPVEARVLNELRGAMQAVHATEGLLVSWGGFKSSIYKQISTSFFSVRLWTQKELLESIFAHYEDLDPDLKAELPLKRIWTIASQDKQ